MYWYKYQWPSPPIILSSKSSSSKVVLDHYDIICVHCWCSKRTLASFPGHLLFRSLDRICDLWTTRRSGRRPGISSTSSNRKMDSNMTYVDSVVVIMAMWMCLFLRVVQRSCMRSRTERETAWEWGWENITTMHNVHNMTSTSDSIFYIIVLNAQMFYKTIQFMLFEEILPPWTKPACSYVHCSHCYWQ